MKPALIVGGVALVVAAGGVLLSGVDEAPSVAAAKLFQRVRALSQATLGSGDAPGPPRVPLSAANVTAAGTVTRPAFEDDDLVDPAPPLPEDEDLFPRGAAPTTGLTPPAVTSPVTAPGSKIAARPVVAAAPEPRRVDQDVKRPIADDRPAARSASRPGLGAGDRAWAAPALPRALTVPRPSESTAIAAPHAAAGNANSGNPAHDDPDSVLPPSPP